jgi:putative transcription factor
MKPTAQQQFAPVILRKTKPSTGPKTTFDGRLANVENQEESFRRPEVGSDFKVALMQARQAKNLKQADLAKIVKVQPNDIANYEAGRAVPSGEVINKLNNALDIKLPKIPKPTIVT